MPDAKPLSPSSPSPKTKRLKLSQQAFIKELTDPTSDAFGNATEAYARSHPKCKSRLGAGVEGHRLLKNPIVADELDHLGWGRERLERELEWNIKTCKDKDKLSDHREGIKVLAQLTGEWKEKQEIAHVESGEKEIVRQLVSAALKPPSTPTVGVQN